MKPKDQRFVDIGFEDFKDLAKDQKLSKYEKIGFPDSYRKGFEEAIFADILAKLGRLQLSNQKVLDIGPGCSDLPMMLIEHCKNKKSPLSLIDSQEMLDQLPAGPEKVSALFPNCPEFLKNNAGSFQVILCYSVLHYVVIDTSLLKFLDSALQLLDHGGQFLIGDIPNTSQRNRFFSSPAGVKFHQEFTQSKTQPPVQFNQVHPSQIDDSTVFFILQRARASGFQAYILPQSDQLPMHNRREDILIVRP